MSIASKNSNHAPLQNFGQSNSKRSLYSDNSYDSNDFSPKRSHNKLQESKKEELVSKKLNDFENKKQMNNLVNSKIKGVEYSEGNKNESKLRGQFMDLKASQKQDILSEEPNNKHFFTNFNTISVTPYNPLPKFGANRYNHNEDYQPNKPEEFSRIPNIKQRSSFYAQKQRMLRSSQGGRWFRSQSLMQNQQKNVNSNGLELKNFFHHGSKYTQTMEKYLKHYYAVQKQLHSKWSKYKFSLMDSLEEVKNKMEAFLEHKIDLSHIPIDRPDVDWGQEQLADFYRNYEPILTTQIQGSEGHAIVLKKYKNCVYYGPILNGKKHGFGYLHYFSGRFFQGLFEDDQKCQGFEMDDSQLYVGHYKKNQRHGQGILKTNQCMLVGQFTNGVFTAPKQIIKNTSENFTNKVRHALFEGFKIQFSCLKIFMKSQIVINKNSQGDIYIGEVRDITQIKEGIGLDIFANGDIYLGRYDQGVPEGYGEYYWQSGAFYRGEFLSGMRHGKGVWMMVNGDKYQGQYMNDKKNGKGVYTWKAGDRYQGQFENDYRHGYGQMRWKDGTMYKGNWSNGIEVNKIIKLQDGPKQPQNYKLPKANTKSNTQATKASIKTIEPKKRGNLTRTSFSRAQKQSRLDSIDKNSRRVPLQKLKAMLNPTNNVN